MALNYRQREAVDAIARGDNVFLTGGAGTGKSFALSEAVAALRRVGRNVVICAPTGVAAQIVGGATIHSVFRFDTLPKIGYEPHVSEVVHQAETIIIDEVSMTRCDLMDAIVDVIAAENEFRAETAASGIEVDFPTAPIQIVAVGDFFQLPPVSKTETDVLRRAYPQSDAFWAFDAHGWDGVGFRNVVLTEQVRQKDAEFARMLNLARCGDVSCLPYFNALVSRDAPEDAVRIVGRNDRANEINDAAVNKISGTPKTLPGKITGQYSIKSFPTGSCDIVIKEGMRVMTLANGDGYSNGSTGTVARILPRVVTIKLDSGETVDVEPYTWQEHEYRLVVDVSGKQKLELDVVGSFTQIPIRPAYAITYHKCQGKTLDKAVLDPDVWDNGQLYVGLSRVRSTSGLYLSREINPYWLKASERVVRFYREMGWEPPERASGSEKPPRRRRAARPKPAAAQEVKDGKDDVSEAAAPSDSAPDMATSLPSITAELRRLLGGKRNWARVYELMRRVHDERLYIDGGYKSFTAWVTAEAKEAGVSPGLLWHRKSAGDFYSSWAADKPDAADLGELPQLSEENLNLVRKISAVDAGLGTSLMNRLVAGTAGNGELRAAWKTARAARGADGGWPQPHGGSDRPEARISTSPEPDTGVSAVVAALAKAGVSASASRARDGFVEISLEDAAMFAEMLREPLG